MCTVSWSALDGQYRLFFNRDERRQRPKASPPVVRWVEGMRLVAPIDPQGGGSWLAVNEKGLTVFLLNYYARSNDLALPISPRTRGEIPLKAASAPTINEAIRRIRELELERYSPFIVGVVALGGGFQGYSWDGTELAALDLKGRAFLTTSSFQSEAVERYRKERFEAMFIEGDEQAVWDRGIDYHCDTDHEDHAFNPLMTRDDAETQSLSVITVTHSSLSFAYRERVSDRPAFQTELVCSLEL